MRGLRSPRPVARGTPRASFEPGRGADPLAHFSRLDLFATALEEPLGKSPSS